MIATTNLVDMECRCRWWCLPTVDQDRRSQVWPGNGAKLLVLNSLVAVESSGLLYVSFRRRNVC